MRHMMSSGHDMHQKGQLEPSFLRHIPLSEGIALTAVDQFLSESTDLRGVAREELARLIWLALAAAVDHLDDEAAFVSECRSLGRSFIGLGLRPRHFPALAHQLMFHLDLEPEEADAWNYLIGRIERVMVIESNQTAPQPAPS